MCDTRVNVYLRDITNNKNINDCILLQHASKRKA